MTDEAVTDAARPESGRPDDDLGGEQPELAADLGHAHPLDDAAPPLHPDPDDDEHEHDRWKRGIFGWLDYRFAAGQQGADETFY